MVRRNKDDVMIYIYMSRQSSTSSVSVYCQAVCGFMLYFSPPLVVWVSHPRLMSLEVWVELKIECWDVTRSSEEMPGRLRASIYEWSGGNYILVSIYHGFHSTSWWCYQTLVPNFTPNIAPKPKSYLFVTLAITCRVLTNQKSRLHPNLLCCRQLPHVVCSLKSITSSGGEEARHLGACVCVCTLWLSRKPHLSFTHRLSAADFGDSVSRAAGKWKRGA